MADIIRLDAQAVSERQGWQFKILRWLVDNADKGDNLMLALVFRSAVLKNNPVTRVPRVGNNSIISPTGYVLFMHMDKEGRIQDVLWSVAKWVETWRRVADAVKLSDAERLELTAALRGWIMKDYRAESGI